jgi:hypothetical protein
VLFDHGTPVLKFPNKRAIVFTPSKGAICNQLATVLVEQLRFGVLSTLNVLFCMYYVSMGCKSSWYMKNKEMIFC